MSDMGKWSVVVLIVILAALIVGLMPGTALAQDAGDGGGRPLVGYYIAVVLCVGAVLWAVCRTSHR